MNPQAEFVVYTSATFSYFAKVATLARSLKQHNPEARFVFLLNERKNNEYAKNLDLSHIDEILYPEDLAIPTADLEAWFFSHNVVEFCTATKPFAMKHLLARYKVPVMYIDPDIKVYSSLRELLNFAPHVSVKLTPHMLAPAINESEIVDHEISCLKHGVFNLGFICVQYSERGMQFVNWWAERLNEYCFADIENGLFTDQRWIDLGFTLFDSAEVVRDVGYNVASWNLSRRKLSMRDGKVFVNENTPLRFFHYSGFDSKTHHRILEKYAKSDEVAAQITRVYEDEQAEFGAEKWKKVPWTFGSYADQSKITDLHRILYRKHTAPGEIKAPFSAETGEIFRQRSGGNHDRGAIIRMSPDQLRESLYRHYDENNLIKNSRLYRLLLKIKGVKNKMAHPFSG